MTFSLLSGEIAKLRVRIEKEVAMATNEVAMVIMKTAAVNTQVDTSQALSNWQVSLNVGLKTFIGPRVPGFGGSTKFASYSSAVSAAQRKLVKRRVGTAIHIVNNAPYIDKLNYGSFTRLPAGFVEKALLAGQNQILKTKLKLT